MEGLRLAVGGQLQVKPLRPQLGGERAELAAVAWRGLMGLSAWEAWSRSLPSLSLLPLPWADPPSPESGGGARVSVFEAGR